MTFHLMQRVSILIFVVAIFSGLGCKKYVRNGELDGGIVLTFDDNYIDDWHSYLPMLDSFNAKATFYVSHYPKLTRQQKRKLRVIQQHGHEIAFHTTRHANLVNLLKTKILQEVMQQEVCEGLDSMKRWFLPNKFCLPLWAAQ